MIVPKQWRNRIGLSRCEVSPMAHSSKSQHLPFLTSTITILRKWLVFPLIGGLLGAMLIGRIVDWVVGPKVYKVYVVGNFQADVLRNTASDPLSPASTAADDIWAALDALGSPGKLDGVPIEFARVPDSGDPVNAERISADLAGRSDCLLVVGHFSSTQTKAALPAYLRGVSPPVPVILTTETNPDLVPPRAAATDYDPIFRLAPTDEDQARTAAAFATQRKANGLWAIQATSNSVYSSYLTSQFVDRALGESDAVVLWTDNTLVPSIRMTESPKVNWIFLLGDGGMR